MHMNRQLVHTNSYLHENHIYLEISNNLVIFKYINRKTHKIQTGRKGSSRTDIYI